MIPQRVLISLHEGDHDEREPQWHGSADASRSPGFTAMRVRGGQGDPAGDDWWRAVDSLHDSGFPDSQYQLDTGHNLWVYHHGDHSGGPFMRDSGQVGFHAQVWHPNGNKGHVVHAYLGNVPEHVGPLLRRAFGHPDVAGHLVGQMTGDPGGSHAYFDMTQAR